MTCHESLDRMMEAEPSELRGEADTELAAHIRDCSRCGRVADTLLAELAAIDAALTSYAAADDATADAAADAVLIRRARGSAAGPLHRRMPGAGTGEVQPVPVRPPRPWVRRAWVPLAAAAVLAAVLVLPGDDPFPTSGTGPTAVAPIDARVAVTPPTDRGAAIMETENPNITIVWLYEREGR